AGRNAVAGRALHTRQHGRERRHADRALLLHRIDHLLRTDGALAGRRRGSGSAGRRGAHPRAPGGSRLHTLPPVRGDSPPGRLRGAALTRPGVRGARTARLGITPTRLGDWTDLATRAARYEALGFDTFWIPDHFVFPWDPREPWLDAWAVLA